MTGAPSTTTDTITDAERRAYYGGALIALRFLETRRATGRRFGPDADARWNDFRGRLTIADRLDTLIRDADLEWAGALGARRAFGLDGVADDDAFGASWEPLNPALADELWRQHQGQPLASLSALVQEIFEAHRRTFVSTPPAAITPTDRFLVAGPSAIASMLLAFEGRTDLDFGQQLLIVATDPLARQLAALGPSLLATGTPTRFATDGGAPQSFTGVLISTDASPADRAEAQRRAS